ncbi:DNA repair protein RecO C-terminal domain-containing protein [Candidatus Dependentiae bacterium]
MLDVNSENDFAFVLKRFFPLKQKTSILSHQNGKIQILTKPTIKCKTLWPGMLISFNLNTSNRRFFCAENINIIYNINNSKPFKIYWIHHVLEICYYFIPLHDPCTKIFSFLSCCIKLINNENTFQSHIKIIKKTFLLNLLVLIGFYPPDNLLLYLDLYKQITLVSIDFNNNHKVQSLMSKLKLLKKQDINNLDKWIQTCLCSHPQFKKFKTLNLKDEF